jgi:hypothetical protein
MTALQRARALGRRERCPGQRPTVARPCRQLRDLLDTDPDDPEFSALRRNELIGRPLGSPDFLDAVSRQLNRVVTPSKRGRKPKAATP